MAQARQVALEYGALAKQGIDVKEHLSNERDKQETLKRLEAAQLLSGSFGQLIDSYITTMRVEGKRTWHRVLASIEKDVYPLISPEQKAATVTDTQIIQVLAKMIDRGADTQANRVRSYLHTAFRSGLMHDKDPAKQHTSVLLAGSLSFSTKNCFNRNRVDDVTFDQLHNSLETREKRRTPTAKVRG